MLGKRKRETVVVSNCSRQPALSSLEQKPTSGNHETFRHFFESTFAPLQNSSKSSLATYENQSESLSDEDTQNSDWSGFSAFGESSPVVEVIDYTNSDRKTGEEVDHIYQKAYMSSKPPQQPKTQADPTASKRSPDAAAEALNLKHDLDLQRLLKESHLLEQSRMSSAPGRQRQRAIDLRFQELGSKSSSSVQEKMPMSHRKGIANKVAVKDAARRKQARDNGVVLEKLIKDKSLRTKKRDRGLDMPAVGKFQSGTLKLSRGDIAHIQGSNTAAKEGRRRGR